MFIYIFVILVSILLAFIAENIRKQYEIKKIRKLKILYKIFCILSFLPPFLVSAFRDYSVGTDTSGTYREIFYNVFYNLGGIRDFGFAFINKIAIWLFNGYYGLLIITSLIFCFLSYKCIFSESKYPTLSVILFFATNVYFLSMNMIRQSLAISLFILSIPQIKNKSFTKFLLINILAISIHSTSAIYLLLYFILNKKLKVKDVIFVCGIVIIFREIFGNKIIEFLCNFEYFRKYFAWYLNSKFSTGELNLYSLLINTCILVFLLLINKKANEDKDYNILLWLETLSVASLLFSANIPMMQRISWLFSFPLYIYLPKMFDYISDSKIRFVVKICIISCYLLYMYITIFIRGYNEVVPYSSIF